MSDNREMIVLNGEQIDELVRCKDCKHYERLMHLCRKFDEFGLAESDFCSRGERRENADSDTCNNDI